MNTESATKYETSFSAEKTINSEILTTKNEEKESTDLYIETPIIKDELESTQYFDFDKETTSQNDDSMISKTNSNDLENIIQSFRMSDTVEIPEQEITMNSYKAAVITRGSEKENPNDYADVPSSGSTTNQKKKGLNKIAIIGIIVGCVIGVSIAAALIIIFITKRKKTNTEEKTIEMNSTKTFTKEEYHTKETNNAQDIIDKDEEDDLNFWL